MSSGEQSPSQVFKVFKESGASCSDIETVKAKMENATIDGVNRLEAEVIPSAFQQEEKTLLNDLEEPRLTPYDLPAGYDFEWTTLDVQDSQQITELHDFLYDHYVEDEDGEFRFQYSADFLRWALMVPGYHKSWHIGVRVTTSQQLVAFISGIPMTVRVRDLTSPVMEINFLCVHKDFRSKRMTPLLMKEIKRIARLDGTTRFFWTAAALLRNPNLISKAQFYHRALNIPVLVDVGFWSTSDIDEAIERNRVGLPSSVGLRPMESRDVPHVTELFNQYMNRFEMVPVLNLAEAEHQFMMTGRAIEDVGSKKVTWSYVVESPETNEVTDFFVFYSLPNTVIDNEEHPVLACAYLYYYATDVAFETGAEEDGRLAERVKALIGDAIILANQMGFHVLNAMTLMDNVPAFEALKFSEGTGVLNYYLENWPTAPLAGMTGEGSLSPGRGVGIIML